MYTLEQGHIRYTDVHIRARSHYTLYGCIYYSRVTLYVIGCIYYSRVTLYVIRMYTLELCHIICYTDFLTRSELDKRITDFHAIQGHMSNLIPP